MFGVLKEEKIFVLLEIVKSLEDFIVIEGDMVCFKVEIFGNFIFDVEWFNNSVKIEGNEEILLEFDGNIYRFVLMDVLLEDEGDYMVIVINEVGKVLCIGKLIVKEKIKKFLFLEVFRDIEVIENSDV